MKTFFRINLESISFHDTFINGLTREPVDLVDGRWSANFTADEKPKYLIYSFGRPFSKNELLQLADNKIGIVEQMPGFRLSWQYSEQLDRILGPCYSDDPKSPSYDPKTEEFVR